MNTRNILNSRSSSGVEPGEYIYHNPHAHKENFFSRLISLFRKYVLKERVLEQFVEQSRNLDLLEGRIKSWNKQSRHTALGALYGIDTRAYDHMALTNQHREALKARIQALKQLYTIPQEGKNETDRAIEEAYKTASVAHMSALMQKAQSQDRAAALVARRELLDLDVTSEQNSEHLNTYLVQELTQAQETILALIQAEEKLAEQLERERFLLEHKDRLTHGGQYDLAAGLHMTQAMLTTPFSRPLFNDINAFDLVAEIAKLEPGADALFQIEQKKAQIIAGHAGRELAKVIEGMQTLVESKITELEEQLETAKRSHKKAAVYQEIYDRLAPLRAAFADAAALRTLEQTIALMQHKIQQLDGQEVSLTNRLATDAIDPFQAQQIIAAEDADALEERMQLLIRERDALAKRSGQKAHLFEEGTITLSQATNKTRIQEDPNLRRNMDQLKLKKQVFSLVVQEPADLEQHIGSMKARAMMQDRPGDVDLIAQYHTEAQSHMGYLFEDLSDKIPEIDAQISRLEGMISQDRYQDIEQLSHTLRSLASIADSAVKDLGKKHPKPAKRLKKVSLRELSDKTKVGARVDELFFQRQDLNLQLQNERYFLKKLKELKLELAVESLKKAPPAQ